MCAFNSNSLSGGFIDTEHAEREPQTCDKALAVQHRALRQSAETQLPSVRLAVFPADRAEIESLHRAFLEIQYDSAFFDSLYDSVSCVTLVVQTSETLVGVITARSWSDSSGGGDTASWAQRQLDWLRGVRSAYIMTFGILPAYRRRGIGSLLLRYLGNVLIRRYACTELQLHCLASNARALALYSAHGFAVSERLRNYYDFGGARHDALRLTCKLDQNLGEKSWWIAATRSETPRLRDISNPHSLSADDSCAPSSAVDSFEGKNAAISRHGASSSDDFPSIACLGETSTTCCVARTRGSSSRADDTGEIAVCIDVDTIEDGSHSHGTAQARIVQWIFDAVSGVVGLSNSALGALSWVCGSSPQSPDSSIVAEPA
jgi:ribosomal protein S18 acetylase RimI-like enzyme